MHIVVQVSWLASDDPKNQTKPNVPTDWNAVTIDHLRKIHAPSLKSVSEQVQALNDKHGKRALFLVPVGQATIALRESERAGTGCLSRICQEPHGNRGFQEATETRPIFYT